jgi:hypothetical protein
MRAMLWLRDDYPSSMNFIREAGEGQWILEVEVYNMEPVNRILRSMPEDVKFFH